jgi:hypothetical protein
MQRTVDGCKGAKARKRLTVGEARTHTHMREILRLKRYRRSCVSVESMLYVNRIHGSVVVVVIFGKTSTSSNGKRATRRPLVRTTSSS